MHSLQDTLSLKTFDIESAILHKINYHLQWARVHLNLCLCDFPKGLAMRLGGFVHISQQAQKVDIVVKPNDTFEPFHTFLIISLNFVPIGSIKLVICTFFSSTNQLWLLGKLRTKLKFLWIHPSKIHFSVNCIFQSEHTYMLKDIIRDSDLY